MSFTLGYFLVQNDFLSVEQVDRAVRRQLLLGGSLDTNLLELGLLEETQLQEAFRKQSKNKSRLKPKWLSFPSYDAVSLVPAELVERFQVLPIYKEGETLHLLAVDAGVPAEHLPLSYWLGCSCVFHLAPEFRILQGIERLYGLTLPARFHSLDRQYPVEELFVLPDDRGVRESQPISISQPKEEPEPTLESSAFSEPKAFKKETVLSSKPITDTHTLKEKTKKYLSKKAEERKKKNPFSKSELTKEKTPQKTSTKKVTPPPKEVTVEEPLPLHNVEPAKPESAPTRSDHKSSPPSGDGSASKREKLSLPPLSSLRSAFRKDKKGKKEPKKLTAKKEKAKAKEEPESKSRGTLPVKSFDAEAPASSKMSIQNKTKHKGTVEFESTPLKVDKREPTIETPKPEKPIKVTRKKSDGESPFKKVSSGQEDVKTQVKRVNLMTKVSLGTGAVRKRKNPELAMTLKDGASLATALQNIEAEGDNKVNLGPAAPLTGGGLPVDALRTVKDLGSSYDPGSTLPGSLQQNQPIRIERGKRASSIEDGGTIPALSAFSDDDPSIQLHQMEYQQDEPSAHDTASSPIGQNTQEIEALLDEYLIASNDEQQLILRDELAKSGELLVALSLQKIPASGASDSDTRRMIELLTALCTAVGDPALHRLLQIIQHGTTSQKMRALLLLGQWRSAKVISPLIQVLLSEREPTVHRMVRKILLGYRNRPEFDKLLKFLKGNLQTTDVHRIQRALELIQDLRLIEVLPELIPLITHQNNSISQSALGTVERLSLQNFGQDLIKWRDWLEGNSDTARKQWIMDALQHPDLGIRTLAKQELREEFGDDFGFDPHSSSEERAAVQKLASLWMQQG